MTERRRHTGPEVFERRGPGVTEVRAVGDPGDTGRFRLLATFLAGRSLAVAAALPGEGAYTDGRFVFVSADRPADEQRREVLCQAALLGAGSLDPEFMKALRGRPKVARRYLALEGRRVVAGLAGALPVVSTLDLGAEPATAAAAESLQVAVGRKAVAGPPKWFGVIRPGRLLSAATLGQGAAPTDKDLRLEFRVSEVPEADEGDEEDGEESKLLKLFQNPLSNSNAFTNFLSKMLGMSRSPGQGSAGGEMPVGSIRRVDSVGPKRPTLARSAPLRRR